MDQGCHCLAKAQQLLIVVGRLPFARAGSGDQTITDLRAEKDTCLLMCEKRHGRVYKAVAVVARASALPGQQVTLSHLVGVELAYFELRSQLAGQVAVLLCQFAGVYLLTLMVTDFFRQLPICLAELTPPDASRLRLDSQGYTVPR
ncbi:hypothetical protein CJT82_23435 [Pseudomonas aeruginosa]|nr:hypothetical protein HMPREF2659_19075 [Pseudomonas aeruginosa]PBX23611.1 hypothetical protein CJT83_14025 [Pseudomonas aeruginosa]PBX27808.1 hypothetical protein CJT82_23435 [Pseudomonas aeruginosa]